MRVAIVRLSSLGDVVHGLPVAHALRRSRPDAEIAWVVERRAAPLLGGNPDLDRLVTVDTRRWRREALRPGRVRDTLRELRALSRELAAARFDVVLDLQGLWKSALVGVLARAPVRIGFARAVRREPASAWLATRRVVPPPEARHVVEMNLALLEALGFDREAMGSAVFPLPFDAVAESTMARYWEAEGLKPEMPLVVLNPGAGQARKRWGVEAFRRLGDRIGLGLGARVLVAWGPGEAPLAHAVAQGMRTTALVPPPTSVPELVALLRRATLVVGGDTGPIHVAAALGVATVGLHGPTRADRNGPFGPRVRSVESPTGRMEDIAVEAVLAAAEALCR